MRSWSSSISGANGTRVVMPAFAGEHYSGPSLQRTAHGVTRCAVRARRLLRLLEEQHGQPGRRAERPRDRRLARAPQAHVTPPRGGHPRL